MKITITSSSVVFTRDIPTSWAEVTFGQFLKLDACGQDHAKIVALLLNMDEDLIRTAKIRDLDGVLLKLRFLQDHPQLELPRTILGYELPKDLGLESIAQFMDLRKDVDNGVGLTDMEKLERYTTYCAMYACRPYDWQKAEALAPEFLNAPAPEVLAVGHFTLLKLIGSLAPTRRASLSLTTRLRNFRLVLRNLLKSMGIMARYYIWRLKPAKAGK